MAPGDGPGAGADPSDDRLRMDLYELLHERVEQERRWQFWRLAAGHLVVGVVFAYAFLFDAFRFVALTPVLYGVVVMDGLRSGVRLLYLQSRLVELEAKLSAREPLFDWVTRYGHFGTGRAIEVGGVDLDTVPRTAQYALIVAIYVSLVVAALIAWRPLDDPATVVDVGATRNLLLLSYATFTALFAAIVLVGYQHHERARERVREAASRRE